HAGESLVVAARPAPERQADDCQHGDRLDHFDDVTGDGSLPLHAVERIAYWPRSQYGHAVHAATVCAAPGTGKIVCADGENATSARRIGGGGEPRPPRAGGAQGRGAEAAGGWAELARPA